MGSRVGWFFLGALFLFTRAAFAEDETWIEPSRINYFLSSFSSVPRDRLELVSSHLQGIRMVQGAKSSDISVFFEKGFDYVAMSREQASPHQVYAIRFPKELRFRLSVIDGVIIVDRLDQKQHRCVLRVRLPFFISDKTYLRRISLDLLTSKARLEMGLVGDQLGWVTEARLSDGFDPRVKWLDTASTNAIRAVGSIFDLVVRGEMP